MTDVAGGTEREVKLAPKFEFELPDLGQSVGRTVRLPEQRLHTSYYDTADLRLFRHGVSLRHRVVGDGEDGIWTVKLPQGDDGAVLERREVCWPGRADAVPEEARRLLAGLLRRADLRRLTELETRRRRIVLHDDEGTSVGELDDDTVTVLGGVRDGVRFRQLELELAPGEDRTTAERVLATLREAGAVPDGVPKLTKALGYLAPTTRRKPPSSRSSIGKVVAAAIEDGLERLLERDCALRLVTEPSPRDVHQARVATRRLRADLKTFRELLDPVWLRHMRSDLRWLGGVFGAVRDVDVLRESLMSEESRVMPGRDLLEGHLQQQRAAAVNELSAALVSDSYLDLLERLNVAAKSPPYFGDTPPDKRARKVLPRLLDERAKSLWRRVEKAGENPPDDELHKIRIRAKQLRYAAEAAAPVLGKRTSRTAMAAANLQTVLGEYRDALSAERWLWRQTRGESGSWHFAAGWLAAEQRRRQRQLRREWPAAFARLAARTGSEKHRGG
jgi:CHAD domain-containing protein